jgi:hypothetical protein
MNYWIPVEEEWRRKHLELLQPHLDLTIKVHSWISNIALHPDVVNGESSNRLKTSRLLLRRLGEELRGVELLAENGHGFQAASAACNLFEQSHFLTFVGGNDANADRFSEWTNLHKSIVTIKELVSLSGKERSWPQSRCDEEYETYRFLCGFKHNNPRFQGVRKLPSNPDVYMSQFALAESAFCVLSAVGLFGITHLKPDNINVAISQCAELQTEVPQLFPTI